MRNFNIDWTNIVDKLDMWKDIPRDDKIVFLRMNATDSKYADEFSDEGVKQLLDSGILASVHEGVKVKRANTVEAREFGKAIRAMSFSSFDVENSISQLH